MNIGLIAMSGVRVRNEELVKMGVTLPGFVQRGKVIASLPSLGLLTIAAMTPPQHDVEYIEISEYCDGDPLPEFELVGISSLSAQIDEAYAVADLYRKRGTQVVMGGLHVSGLPDEALEHADAVVIAGAEGIWPTVVKDAAQGKLKERYIGARNRVFSPDLYIQPRFQLLSGRDYNRVTVQTSRGCPRSCEFCGASLRITDKFNQKPVDLVIEEIREAKKFFPHPFFELADDNSFINREWTRDFLKKVAHEEIHWFTETDVSIADDPELCDLLAESGCRQVLIGFESPNGADINGIDPANWKAKHAPKYREAIDTLQSRGVSVNGCFVLGLDSHTTDVFPEALEFVRSSGLEEVQFTVLTPFPNTPLYQRFKLENRLLKEKFWENCTLFDVNYQPAKMSVEDLEKGLRWIFSETYTAKETKKRQQHFAKQSRQGRLRRKQNARERRELHATE